MKIALYGSSLVSAYWNGAATYYRGLLRALARLGYAITFYEPDAFERRQHRDIPDPDWATSVVFPADPAAARAVAQAAATADVVIKASGVGVFDDLLLETAMASAKGHALRLYCDVDAPATVAELRLTPEHPLRRLLPSLDAVITYGGGPPIVAAYRALGARRCQPIPNGLDPMTHHPAPFEPLFRADLSLLANRLPDREARIETFFFTPARTLPDARFLLGGAGWEGAALPPQVTAIGHVPTGRHNAFNCSARAVLNVARDSMAAMGWSPATRVFEAAGAGACLISDAWEGFEAFFHPGEEVLIARDGQDVADIVRDLSPARARAIGQAARARALTEHTYAQRAAQLDRLLQELAAAKRDAVRSA